MSSLRIRVAQPDDATLLAQVHIQAWQEAYVGIIPQAYLDHLPSELGMRITNWQRTLAHPQRWVWVAEGSSGIVGFALFGPPRDPDREDFIELGAIYLLAAEKGKGVGFSLLSAGFAQMAELGYRRAYCWVLEGNPTIKFYEGVGAVASGIKKQDEIGG